MYLTAADVRRATDLLDPSRFAVTVGTVNRPLMRDTVGQLYSYAGMPRSGPPSYRCRAYTVHTIHTDSNATLNYDHPLETLSDLQHTITRITLH
ncbi:hypothetical protein [Mycolicibacterium sp.]|uniref:hypothetical protein n=1 Tax=Mycolicibacterium sp. TaxID=2320850 RepID=UPI003D139D2D